MNTSGDFASKTLHPAKNVFLASQHTVDVTSQKGVLPWSMQLHALTSHALCSSEITEHVKSLCSSVMHNIDMDTGSDCTGEDFLPAELENVNSGHEGITLASRNLFFSEEFAAVISKQELVALTTGRHSNSYNLGGRRPEECREHQLFDRNEELHAFERMHAAPADVRIQSAGPACIQELLAGPANASIPSVMRTRSYEPSTTTVREGGKEREKERGGAHIAASQRSPLMRTPSYEPSTTTLRGGGEEREERGGHIVASPKSRSAARHSKFNRTLSSGALFYSSIVLRNQCPKTPSTPCDLPSLFSYYLTLNNTKQAYMHVYIFPTYMRIRTNIHTYTYLFPTYMRIRTNMHTYTYLIHRHILTIHTHVLSFLPLHNVAGLSVGECWLPTTPTATRPMSNSVMHACL
jgi:hypothetical protein